MISFSLFEAMLVSLLIGVFTMMSLPTIQELWIQNHISLVSNQITRCLSCARSEALKRRHNVILCPNNPRDWRNGQIIVDEKTKRLIYSFPSLTMKDHLFWRSSFGKNDKIIFQATGFTLGQRGSFYYCYGEKCTHQKRFILELSGRVRESIW